MSKIDWKKINIIICSIYTTIIFSMRYGIVEDEIIKQVTNSENSLYCMLLKLLYAIDDHGILSILVMLFCFILYKYSFSIGKLKTEEKVTGILLALTFLFGKTFNDYGSTIILVTGLVQTLKTILILCGYILFFTQFVKAIRYYLSNANILNKGFDIDDPVKYRRIVLIILMVFWGFHLIAYYPGMFQGDTEDIIHMAYNYHTGLADTVELISEDVLLVDHHSVLYTIILGSFVKLGQYIFNSENIGIFMYTIVQMIFTAWVLAYSLYKMKKYNVNAGIRTVSLVFLCLFPWIPRYAIMATKDTLFADFLLLYLLIILDIVEQNKEKIPLKQLVLIVIYAIIIFLLRKNGLYVVLLSVPFLMMIQKKWIKSLVVIMVCVFLSKFLYSDVILSAAKITDGSVSAALSIPLQQTSRYLKYYGDEVTEEEKEAIDSVVVYDSVSTIYWADRSDWAKAAWRKEADGEDMKNYFIVWAKMFVKHPLTYVAATANNCYGYFYPVVIDMYEFERSSDGAIQSANAEGYFNFAASDSSISMLMREILRLWDTVLMRIPVINLICTSALYIWILVWAWTVSILKKDRKLLMLVIPMLMLMLTILSGPCNGNIYHRFTYPVVMCIPLIAGYAMREHEDEVIK
ncbi:MAG: hypothetical protein II312_03375 [Lachnospiraceae bacterium]|nr:hypothetical protein [Lachnospiraceae bacterium]